jgi:hypothetical protein
VRCRENTVAASAAPQRGSFRRCCSRSVLSFAIGSCARFAACEISPAHRELLRRLASARIRAHAPR